MNKRTFLSTVAALALFSGVLTVPAFAIDPDAALKELATKVWSKGPNGEDPVSAASITLTEEEIAYIAQHVIEGVA